ncbi:MAG: transposase [Desulfobacteraceae bacterium]|nr:transposase [Desulfobacteraceae bacterium]
MAQSLSRILLHLIFSTKNREPLINKNIRPDLHAYIAGVCRKLNSEAYRVGGTEDPWTRKYAPSPYLMYVRTTCS